MKRWSRMLFLSICLMCVLCACMGQKEDILIGGEEDATGTIQSIEEDAVFLRIDQIDQRNDQLKTGDVVALRTLEMKELDPEEALLLQITELLELEGVLSRHPFDISGGEQQRLALGKVLLPAPDVLLLDEPTKGMDGEFKRRFGELLSRLKAEGKTIFLVSHDIEFCAQCADRCALLFRGEIVCRSAPRKFFSGNFFYTTAAARLSRGMIENAVLTGEVIECLKQ